jgi:hypothetical protein
MLSILYNVLIRTQLYLESGTWSITLSTTCFGLYIGHHQVYLKLTEILYNPYGVLWGIGGGGVGGNEISFYNSGWHEIRILGWSFLTSAVVFCRGAPWSTLYGLVKPGRLLCRRQ